MGLLAVASRQRKLAMANGHPEMRTWIRPLLDAPLWCLRTASGGWLCARQPPKSPTRSGLGDDLSAPEFRRVGHGQLSGESGAHPKLQYAGRRAVVYSTPCT